jgi:lipoprotein-anchoring transpeptidase ErfK/SrfK
MADRPDFPVMPTEKAFAMPISRRRLLLGVATAAVFPGAARAQPVFDPLGDFLRGIFGDPARPPAPPPDHRLPQQANEEVSPEEWYLDSIPDGQFQIRRVDFSKLDPEFRRQLVPLPTQETPGTLVVDPRNHFLYSVREGGQAVRYGVGVGREGFGWKGRAYVGRKAEWPDWIPPAEMRLRQPELPERMPGGPTNPLGARALYLYEGNRDTLYRIHGTAEPWTIGQNVSSGCIRMLNEEVADLYLRTPIGTRVTVL